MTHFPPDGHAPEACGMKPHQPLSTAILVALIAGIATVEAAVISGAATMLAPVAATHPILALLLWLLLTGAPLAVLVRWVRRWARG